MERTTLYLCFKRASSIAPQNRFIGPDDVGPVVLIGLTKAWEIGTDYHVDWRALGVSPSHQQNKLEIAALAKKEINCLHYNQL